MITTDRALTNPTGQRIVERLRVYADWLDYNALHQGTRKQDRTPPNIPFGASVRRELTTRGLYGRGALGDPLSLPVRVMANYFTPWYTHPSNAYLGIDSDLIGTLPHLVVPPDRILLYDWWQRTRSSRTPYVLMTWGAAAPAPTDPNTHNLLDELLTSMDNPP